MSLVLTASGAEADFTSRTVNLTFNEVLRIHRVNISINNDLLLEDDETFQSTVSLVTSEGGIMLDPQTATITILNDDGEDRRQPAFTF